MLVVDRTNVVGVDKPGLHALIIGVSDYTYLPAPGGVAGPLGFYKVAGPAASAYKIARWLEAAGGDYRTTKPLKTLRLMILPSASEDVQHPWPGGPPGTPDVDAVVNAVKAWRNDCNSCGGENVALFYFSGHGINASSDDVLLAMADAGKPDDGPYDLDRFIRIQTIFQAMVPSDDYMNMAKHQFYFVDACRTDNQTILLKGARSDRGIGGNSGTDDGRRSAPIYFAAPALSPAFAPSPAGTLYGTALLRCLNNSSADLRFDDQGNPVYIINTLSLRSALNNAMGRKLPIYGFPPEDVELVMRSNAPDIEMTVNVRPATQGPLVQLKGQDVDRNLPIPPIKPIGASATFTTAVGRYSFDVSYLDDKPLVRFAPRSLVGPVELINVDVRQ
jgi:hypothetical protein